MLDCTRLDVSAKKLNKSLCNIGVYSELVTEKYIVFILTAADTPDSVFAIKRALHRGIGEAK